MSTFTFDFDLQDDLDESFDAISLQDPRPIQSNSVIEKRELLPAEEIPLSALLSSLPEALSYSPLTLPGSHYTIARRDLFDARFQLFLRPIVHDDGNAAEQQNADNSSTTTTAAVDSDLLPGIYEGGLKTWECALDLAAYLDRLDVLGTRTTTGEEQKRTRTGTTIRGLRLLELGCGTAVPTLLLLDHLFTLLASDTLPSSDGNDVPPPPLQQQQTEIHLQDYNRSVLELVTFPNILIAWYVSPLSAEYRSTTTIDDSDSDSIDDNRRGRGGPGSIIVSQALLSAFTASLEAHRVQLRFFAGSWATSLHDLLFLPLLAPPPSPPPPPRPYDIVLASETIYRSETLDAFIDLLRAATTTMPTPPTFETTRNVQEPPPPPPLCLVAAKVLYFGVGGGVEGFVRAVEAKGGSVRTVWEHREGVGRRIMSIEW